jgi:hypothetical protein
MRIKTIILLAIVVSFINVTTFNMAYAFFGGSETNQDCVNGSCNENKSHHNNYGDTYNNGDTYNKGGNGGNAKSNSDASVNIGNGMFNKVLSPEQKQGQVQGQDQSQLQLQGQDQKQGQSQSSYNDNSNKGNRQQTVITFEDNVDYNHIGSGIKKTNAYMRNTGDTIDVKTVSSIYDRIVTIDHKSAKSLSKDTKDFKVYSEILFEKPFQTSHITKGIKGVYMGSLVFVPDGEDITKGGLTGQALVKAMKVGATNFVITYSDGKYLQGSKAGIDFGTAASIAAESNGSTMIAPGSTLGYSKAWSNNEYRSGLVIDLYFDNTIKIKPHNPDKHETRWIK